VVEVVLTVQFAAPAVDLEVLAAFRTAVKAELPRSEQQPLLAPLVERFDVAPRTPSFEIRFDTQAGLPRSWFLSEDQRQLVQLQPDRLSLNWRRMDDSDAYPRYATLRDTFTRHLEVLRGCIRDAGRPIPGINLVELVYVNAIEFPGSSADDDHPDLARIINRFNPGKPAGFLGQPEDAQLEARWRIPGTSLGVERPAGRLYLSATPALKASEISPIYMVTMTGRVMPTEGNPEAAMEALDVAHEWVVLGFDDLTTPEMHRLWERHTGS